MRRPKISKPPRDRILSFAGTGRKKRGHSFRQTTRKKTEPEARRYFGLHGKPCRAENQTPARTIAIRNMTGKAFVISPHITTKTDYPTASPGLNDAHGLLRKGDIPNERNGKGNEEAGRKGEIKNETNI